MCGTGKTVGVYRYYNEIIIIIIRSYKYKIYEKLTIKNTKMLNNIIWKLSDFYENFTHVDKKTNYAPFKCVLKIISRINLYTVLPI